MLSVKDQEELDRIRARLQEQLNKVPSHVLGGSIQVTRDWLRIREEAQKMLKKRNGVGPAELLSMISRLQ